MVFPYKFLYRVFCRKQAVSFAEKDGEAYFVRDDEYHRLYVEDNRIVIEGLDPQYEGYWGDSRFSR